MSSIPCIVVPIAQRASRWRWTFSTCAGFVASLMLHGLALGAVVALSLLSWSQPPRLGAKSGAVVIETSFSEAEPPMPAMEITFSRDDVVIFPDRASVADRRFVDAPTARVPLESFLTRDVLDRLLQSEDDAVAQASEMEKETLAANVVSPMAVEQPPTPRPPSPRRPVTKVKAEIQHSEPTPQTEAGLRTGPSFAGNRPPSYPSLAQRNGWQGRVLLRLHINAEGAVTNVEVVRSSGYAILDAEAVATLRTWRGTPATFNGRPVETVALQSVRFGPRR